MIFYYIYHESKANDITRFVEQTVMFFYVIHVDYVIRSSRLLNMHE